MDYGVRTKGKKAIDIKNKEYDMKRIKR